MRPMPTIGSDNVTGAFTPANHSLRAIDTNHRLATKETLVPSVRGVGVSPAYGTYIDIQKTNWGVSRFYKTKPVAMLPLKMRLPRYANQVQNPTLAHAMPGYTSNLNMMQTQLGRMATKGYNGGPSQPGFTGGTL